MRGDAGGAMRSEARGSIAGRRSRFASALLGSSWNGAGGIRDGGRRPSGVLVRAGEGRHRRRPICSKMAACETNLREPPATFTAYE